MAIGASWSGVTARPRPEGPDGRPSHIAPGSPETFTRAPAVPFDPDARAPVPVRAAFPGEEPPKGLRPLGDLGPPPDEAEPNIRLARAGRAVRRSSRTRHQPCIACAHRCVLRPSRIGICGVRQNRGGRLYTLVYGQAVVSQAEPIEKKPFSPLPARQRASGVATQGRNFHRATCQNWRISQAHREGRVPESRYLAPGRPVEEAVAAGARAIAYTYVEPTVFLEYALDTITRARGRLAQRLRDQRLREPRGSRSAGAAPGRGQCRPQGRQRRLLSPRLRGAVGARARHRSWRCRSAGSGSS